jgi:hypothetical protein
MNLVGGSDHFDRKPGANLGETLLLRFLHRIYYSVVESYGNALLSALLTICAFAPPVISEDSARNKPRLVRLEGYLTPML